MTTKREGLATEGQEAAALPSPSRGAASRKAARAAAYRVPVTQEMREAGWAVLDESGRLEEGAQRSDELLAKRVFEAMMQALVDAPE